jgi:hypothetical protein
VCCGRAHGPAGCCETTDVVVGREPIGRGGRLVGSGPVGCFDGRHRGQIASMEGIELQTNVSSVCGAGQVSVEVAIAQVKVLQSPIDSETLLAYVRPAKTKAEEKKAERRAGPKANGLRGWDAHAREGARGRLTLWMQCRAMGRAEDYDGRGEGCEREC